MYILCFLAILDVESQHTIKWENKKLPKIFQNENIGLIIDGKKVYVETSIRNREIHCRCWIQDKIFHTIYQNEKSWKKWAYPFIYIMEYFTTLEIIFQSSLFHILYYPFPQPLLYLIYEYLFYFDFHFGIA